MSPDGTATHYDWGEKAVFTTGVTEYNENQSRAFISWNGNRYYGPEFDTQLWTGWSCGMFLFRGVAQTWKDETGFLNVYQCGPATIYDIKIWRKKAMS